MTQRWTEEMLDRLAEKVDRLSEDADKRSQDMRETNIRIDAYQKSATQVVNLAFALLATATITVIVSSVLK
ncbi:MAG: hypothetical protein F6J87_26630 [Spirulina sp. SIO3F2]|nr:hypothetical protein [Spirulina sp. SIO3F2]